MASVGVEPTTFALLARRSNRLSYTAYTHGQSCSESFTRHNFTVIKENWKALTTQLALFVMLESDTMIWIMTTKTLAERGFDPRTSGLWAQHASTAPLCSTNDEVRERYSMLKKWGWCNPSPADLIKRWGLGIRRVIGIFSTWHFLSMTKKYKKEKKKNKKL